jgi:hypothetical protein
MHLRTSGLMDAGQAGHPLRGRRTSRCVDRAQARVRVAPAAPGTQAVALTDGKPADRGAGCAAEREVAARGDDGREAAVVS